MFSASSPPALSLPHRTSPHFFGSPPSTSPPSPTAAVCGRSRPLRVAATYTSTERSPPLSPTISSISSLYDVLGLSADATCQEIKSAYRRLVRMCHPDVVSIDRKDTSADEFMKIHTAYSTLSDPEKRADYDRKLLMRGRPAARPFPSGAGSYRRASSFGGYSRRTWETDQCW